MRYTAFYTSMKEDECESKIFYKFKYIVKFMKLTLNLSLDIETYQSTSTLH